MRSRRSNSFDSISLGLLSPEVILERSYGEVLKPSVMAVTSFDLFAFDIYDLFKVRSY